jgi:hypothetical protein
MLLGFMQAQYGGRLPQADAGITSSSAREELVRKGFIERERNCTGWRTTEAGAQAYQDNRARFV